MRKHTHNSQSWDATTHNLVRNLGKNDLRNSHVIEARWFLFFSQSALQLARVMNCDENCLAKANANYTCGKRMDFLLSTAGTHVDTTQPSQSKLTIQRLAYFCHVSQGHGCGCPSIVLHAPLGGPRFPGRPAPLPGQKSVLSRGDFRHSCGDGEKHGVRCGAREESVRNCDNKNFHKLQKTQAERHTNTASDTSLRIFLFVSSSVRWECARICVVRGEDNHARFRPKRQGKPSCKETSRSARCTSSCQAAANSVGARPSAPRSGQRAEADVYSDEVYEWGAMRPITPPRCTVDTLLTLCQQCRVTLPPPLLRPGSVLRFKPHDELTGG